ncbi:hypothetical protein N1851_030178 [Merluccius polli]|uniref:Uncharacterized protein n=1 Tax=Merluccius polli TaxID=89951 RepID=A0AA47NR50_MERPO|nr:hypothetical protein N1851_030178 [Merluccius polli]
MKTGRRTACFQLPSVPGLKDLSERLRDTAQWRMYHRVLGVGPKTAARLVKVTVVHNFLRWQDEAEPRLVSAPQDLTSSALQHITRVGSNNSSWEAVPTNTIIIY